MIKFIDYFLITFMKMTKTLFWCTLLKIGAEKQHPFQNAARFVTQLDKSSKTVMECTVFPGSK